MRIFPALLMGALFLFPVRVVLGANPEWRPALWMYALTIFALTLGLLWKVGGRRWVFHFGPAFVLMLFAVPWPTFVETPVTAGLMQWIAAIVVESMNLLGIYAEQSGNLIRLRNGWVGIEEACSGVRNFQSTLMSAWFIGELFRFTGSGRLLLLALGGVASLLLNLGRTWILTWLTHSREASLTEAVHDPVGHIVSAIAFLLLLALAFGLRRWFGREGKRERRVGSSNTKRSSVWEVGGRPVTRGMCVWVLFLLVAGHLATWGWYYRAERELGEPRRVEVFWGALPFDPGFVEIAPAIRSQLRYSEGVQAEWEEPGEVRWTVFSFAWDSGTVSPFVGVHTPQTCLPASGFTPEGNHSPLQFVIDGHTITFSATTFAFLSTPVQVYYATWEDHWGEGVPFVETSADRLRLAWSGRRITHKRSLQIVIEGLAEEDRAREMAERFLRTTLRWRE